MFRLIELGDDHGVKVQKREVLMDIFHIFILHRCRKHQCHFDLFGYLCFDELDRFDEFLCIVGRHAGCIDQYNIMRTQLFYLFSKSISRGDGVVFYLHNVRIMRQLLDGTDFVAVKIDKRHFVRPLKQIGITGGQLGDRGRLPYSRRSDKHHDL